MAKPILATTDVFQNGDIHWKQLNVDTSSCPKPLLVFTPTVPGIYPVILFCHGFCIRNSFYSKLLGHITSHGFIVVAPQLVLHISYPITFSFISLFVYVFNIPFYKKNPLSTFKFLRV